MWERKRRKILRFIEVGLSKNKVGYELGATHRIVASRIRINFFERSLQTKDTYFQSSI